MSILCIAKRTVGITVDRTTTVNYPETEIHLVSSSGKAYFGLGIIDCSDSS